MSDVSVIICCFNSSNRIEKTLKCLSEQTFLRNISLEIILVNNNSDDDTSEKALNIWRNLDSSIPLIIINEPKPGLSEARETGIKHSKSDLIIFCDDDNRLFHDYIQIAFDTMNADNKIAVLGGQGYPDYEINPPDYISDHVSQYATGPQASESGDITVSKGYVYGAGIVIRKSYYNYIKKNGFDFSLSGRKGNVLTSGEDFELCAAFILAGYKIWYNSELKFFHYLPSGRLTWDYLIRMNQGFGYSLAFLLPYITLLNMENKVSYKYSYYYFLLKCFIKQLLSFNVIKLLKKSDERLEWERTKYLSISLRKNSSAIKKLMADLPQMKFVRNLQ